MPTWRNWQIRGHTHTRGPRVPTAGLLHAAHCPKNAFCHPIPTVLLSPFYRQGTQERLPRPRAHSGSMRSPNPQLRLGEKTAVCLPGWKEEDRQLRGDFHPASAPPQTGVRTAAALKRSQCRGRGGDPQQIKGRLKTTKTTFPPPKGSKLPSEYYKIGHF